MGYCEYHNIGMDAIEIDGTILNVQPEITVKPDYAYAYVLVKLIHGAVGEIHEGEYVESFGV